MKNFRYLALAILAAFAMSACGGSEEKPSTVAGDTATASEAPTSTPQANAADTGTTPPAATTGEAEEGHESDAAKETEHGENKESGTSSKPPTAVTEAPKTPTTAPAPTETPKPPAAPVETKPTTTPTPPSSPPPAAPPAQPTSAGKTIYRQSKCDNCHAVSAQGIARTAPAAEGQEPPPDLSHVGKQHDASWIMRWLQKKETLNGKKHIKGFKGTDEELKTLADWLAGMK